MFGKLFEYIHNIDYIHNLCRLIRTQFYTQLPTMLHIGMTNGLPILSSIMQREKEIIAIF